MKNSSLLTANISNNKILSLLFVCLFIGLAQTAIGQTHVVILKGNRTDPPPHLVCVDQGGGFIVGVENTNGYSITDIVVTITMVGNSTGTNLSSVHYIGTLKHLESGFTSFNIPSNFPNSSGYFIIEVSHQLNTKNIIITQNVPFDFEC